MQMKDIKDLITSKAVYYRINNIKLVNQIETPNGIFLRLLKERREACRSSDRIAKHIFF
jgi:hypothetical protein